MVCALKLGVPEQSFGKPDSWHLIFGAEPGGGVGREKERQAADSSQARMAREKVSRETEMQASKQATLTKETLFQKTEGELNTTDEDEIWAGGMLTSVSGKRGNSLDELDQDAEAEITVTELHVFEG